MTSNPIYVPSFICVLNCKIQYMTKIDSVESFLNLINCDIFKGAAIKFVRISPEVQIILKQIENTTIAKRDLFKLLKTKVQPGNDYILSFRGYTEEEKKLKKNEIYFNNYDVCSVMKKYHLTEDEARIKIEETLSKNITQRTVQYWINRGYSEEDAKIEVSRVQSDSGKLFGKRYKENPENYKGKFDTHLEYYLSRGFSLEEAKIALKDRQTTFSLDKLLIKHPEDEAFRLWDQRQEKWQNSLNSKSTEEKDKINKSKGINKHGIPHSFRLNESSYEEDCVLYYVKITHKEIDYYKIGITNSIDSRFGNLETNKLKYDIDIKILFTLNTNRLSAYNIEQKILRDFNHKRTSIKSGGFKSTEIFTENVLSNFNDYLNRIEHI